MKKIALLVLMAGMLCGAADHESTNKKTKEQQESATKKTGSIDKNSENEKRYSSCIGTYTVKKRSARHANKPKLNQEPFSPQQPRFKAGNHLGQIADNNDESDDDKTAE
jgi:hypothetical protein